MTANMKKGNKQNNKRKLRNDIKIDKRKWRTMKKNNR